MVIFKVYFMEKIYKLSKALKSLGLRKESNKALSLVKNAYINNAKILVTIAPNVIISILKGDLPSGNSVSFGRCEVVNISAFGKKIKMPSEGNKSIWEFHRNIFDKEYEGLGYMNDLLTSAIFHVQNNGGIVFNGIGSQIYGSGVSEDGKNHTLNKLNKNFEKTPVIIFYNKLKNTYMIFKEDEKDLAQKIYEESFRYKIDKSIINDLFSNPYSSYGYGEGEINSGFKITAKSQKTSIPVSIEFHEDKDEINNHNMPTFYNENLNFYKKTLKLNVEKIKELIEKLISKFFNLLITFLNQYEINRLKKIISYNIENLASKNATIYYLDDYIINIIKNYDIEYDKEKFDIERPNREAILNELIKVIKEDDDVYKQKEEIYNTLQKEYEDRREHIGNIRGIK